MADIHGNLPALEAVIDTMPPVDQLVCLGDMVGYNPWPRECVDLVRDVADIILQGNHDRVVDDPSAYSHNEMAQAGIRYAHEELSREDRNWLRSLPDRREIDEFVLVHSHPDPEMLDTYVLPRDFPRMRPYLDEYTGILIGHTHIQHEAVIDDRLILNPGSVGQPRDRDSRAAYAVVDTESFETELCRVEYPIDEVLRAIDSAGLPSEIGERLVEGR